jgi:hypothetical protein
MVYAGLMQSYKTKNFENPRTAFLKYSYRHPCQIQHRKIWSVDCISDINCKNENVLGTNGASLSTGSLTLNFDLFGSVLKKLI